MEQTHNNKLQIEQEHPTNPQIRRNKVRARANEVDLQIQVRNARSLHTEHAHTDEKVDKNPSAVKTLPHRAKLEAAYDWNPGPTGRKL